MKKASEAFLYVAKKFNWIKIDCVENWEMRSIENIGNELYEKVHSYLDK
jgi:hypothetical protein